MREIKGKIEQYNSMELNWIKKFVCCPVDSGHEISTNVYGKPVCTTCLKLIKNYERAMKHHVDTLERFR